MQLEKQRQRESIVLIPSEVRLKPRFMFIEYFSYCLVPFGWLELHIARCHGSPRLADAEQVL